jgi:uncharacterized protein (DUF1330 family)
VSEAKVFVIVQIEVHDWDGYQQYGSAPHQEIFDKFGATVVGLDEAVDVVEGTWPFTRTVLIAFPSKAMARAWYESDEYRAVVGLRHGSATSNLVIVGGYPS